MTKEYSTACSLKNGLLSLAAEGKRLFSMKNLSAAVSVEGKMLFAERLLPSKDPLCAEYELIPGLILTRRLAKEKRSWTLRTALRNNGKKSLEIGDFSVLYGDAEKDFSLNLGKTPEKMRFFAWRPWYMDIGDLSRTETEFSGNTLLHLSDPASGFTMFVSFITFDRMDTRVILQTGKKKGEVRSFSMLCYASGFSLKPGKTLEAETIRISTFSDPYFALENWADEANRRYKPDFTGTAGVCVTNGIWHDTFTSRSENPHTRMLKTMNAAEEKLGRFGLDLMGGGSHAIFKDGLPGNWMKFEKCPQGDYGKLQSELFAKRKWKFKSWFSPFWFFGEAKQTLEENETNLLKNADGTAYVQEFSSGWEFGRGKYNHSPLHRYYLDGTDPKTHKYLEKVFKFYRRMGVRAYMLDFLYTIPGTKRHDETLLPVEISRSVFRTIRKACTKDTHLQTAVSSSPAYIGCIHSARVVRDFGEGRPQYPFPNWNNANYCMHDLHFSNAFSFIQNAAASWFTNRKIYVNDLNEMTIDHPVPLENARMAVTMFGLSGDSPVCLGDDPANIHPERLRMLKMILPRTKGIPVPVDLFDAPTLDGGCHILRKAIRTKYDSYMLAAVFNPDPEMAGIHAAADAYGGKKLLGKKAVRRDYETEIDFARLGLDPKKKYVVYEFWNNEYCGICRKGFSCKIPLGTCRLYRITEYRDYPWLISTDLHVEQGNAEIENVVYDPEKLTLAITAKRPVGESGRAVVILPRKYRIVNHENINTMKEVIDMQTICGVPLDFDREKIKVVLQLEKIDTPYLAYPGWFPYRTEEEWLKFVKTHPYSDPNRVIE